jgi:hypothetical protein
MFTSMPEDLTASITTLNKDAVSSSKTSANI